jgi:hypothetical protein
MTKITTIKCDFCDRTKGEVNHWFGLRIMDRNLPPTLWIFPLTSDGDDPEKHACGHDCVVQGVSRFMDHRTLQPG